MYAPEEVARSYGIVIIEMCPALPACPYVYVWSICKTKRFASLNCLQYFFVTGTVQYYSNTFRKGLCFLLFIEVNVLEVPTIYKNVPIDKSPGKNPNDWEGKRWDMRKKIR